MDACERWHDTPHVDSCAGCGGLRRKHGDPLREYLAARQRWITRHRRTMTPVMRLRALHQARIEETIRTAFAGQALPARAGRMTEPAIEPLYRRIRDARQE